jgi:Rps23 Pro-64 3,4-dihydroxylase Tpa1-like proline 4-hydroxylase
MKLTKYDEFFTEELYEELINTAKYLLRQGVNTFYTNAWWSENIVKDSFPVLIHAIHRDSELFAKVREQIEKKIKLAVKDHDIMIYYWTRFSYIPWHEDQNYEGTLTVYLNEEWHPDWGGYFLYEDKKQDVHAILPKRNFGLLQQGGIRHSTTPVNFDGGMRISIQVFLDKPE